jgi:hypothetical protein
MHARRVGVRRRINSGKQATPVTLGYRKSVISSGSLRYLELDAGVGRTPQDPHGLNGTLRYTCYACERHEEQPVSSVDARELGCQGFFQVSALGMTDLLKSGSSNRRSSPYHACRFRACHG